MPTYSNCTDCCTPGGGGGIDVDCCPNQIAQTLQATVSNVVGTCPCLDLSFTLTYNAGSQQWESPAQCSMSGPVTLSCFTGSTDLNGWFITYAGSDSTAIVVANSSCNPLSLEFDVQFNDPDTCNGAATATVTVTE